MKTKSRASEKRLNPKRRMVQKSARELTPPSARDLERLRRAMEEGIDTSEIPERRSGRAVRSQRSPEQSQGAAPGSAIRDAIRRELGRRQITRYELWKRARVHWPTLSESAVYEFLRGERQIGLEYVEALLAAVDLEVRRRDEAVLDVR
ncbi:MAG TPA: hypothetical protein VHN14_12380 [Kofleriaceae bacterium]|jgi:hypothetical protein|nr:hypothetical protein [Kofleriaceae bacterium]